MMLNVWNRPYDVILKCLRGLEHNLFDELQSFGIERNSLVKYNRGVRVLDCNLKQLYFLSYFPRLSTKVYFEVGKFSLLDKERLFKGCEKIQWLDFINSNNSYLIDCNVLSMNSHINSRKYACQLVKDGINKHFTSNLNIEAPTISFKNPEIKLEVEVDEECNATILVDSVGSSLSNRGYRHKPNITDIDPTLSCSILFDMGYSSYSDPPFSILEYEKLCNTNTNTNTYSNSNSNSDSNSNTNTNDLNPDINLDQDSNLDSKLRTFESNRSELSNSIQKPSIVDLFSGCGVFLIEAALLATKIPPGYFRNNFSFQKFSKFDDFSFQMLKKYTDYKRIKPDSEEWKNLKGKFIGIERDWEKLESSVLSSETAGTLDLMSFNQAVYLKDGLNDAKKDYSKNLDRENLGKDLGKIKGKGKFVNGVMEYKDEEKNLNENNKSYSIGWDYMVAKLPQMKRLGNLLENTRVTNYNNNDLNSNSSNNKNIKEKQNEESQSDIDIDKNKVTKISNEYQNKYINKTLDDNKKHNLSQERYMKLLNSLSNIRKKYFSPDSKGVLIVPSFIDKNKVQESFNSKLSMGKTFNKDGIYSTTYYTE